MMYSSIDIWSWKVLKEYQILDGEDKTTAFYIEGEKCTSYMKNGGGVTTNHYWECIEDCIHTLSHQEYEDQLPTLMSRLDSITTQVAMVKLNHDKEG